MLVFALEGLLVGSVQACLCLERCYGPVESDQDYCAEGREEVLTCHEYRRKSCSGTSHQRGIFCQYNCLSGMKVVVDWLVADSSELPTLIPVLESLLSCFRIPSLTVNEQAPDNCRAV